MLVDSVESAVRAAAESDGSGAWGGGTLGSSWADAAVKGGALGIG
jgi:hypothetical protein